MVLMLYRNTLNFRYTPTLWFHEKLVSQAIFSLLLFVCLLRTWSIEDSRGDQSTLHTKLPQCAINNTKNC